MAAQKPFQFADSEQRVTRELRGAMSQRSRRGTKRRQYQVGRGEILRSGPVTRCHHGEQAGALGRRQAVGGILDGHAIHRVEREFAQHVIIDVGSRFLALRLVAAPITENRSSAVGPRLACSNASTLARLVVVAMASCTPAARASSISRTTPSRKGIREAAIMPVYSAVFAAWIAGMRPSERLAPGRVDTQRIDVGREPLLAARGREQLGV